jgi:hypothetical protein
MRPSTPRARYGRSIVGKIVLALAVASMMVGVSMGPAFSEDNGRHEGQQERNQRAHQSYKRAHHSYNRAYLPYGYYPPPPVIYAPPPVVYVPPPSPGISLFFGFPIRIH